MMVLSFLSPETARTVLLTLVGIGYVGYHAVLAWKRQKAKTMGRKSRKVTPTETVLRAAPCPPQPLAHDCNAAGAENGAVFSDRPAGEDLFKQARALPHQPIPDFETDGSYLELLNASAAVGYAPACAKLGEYAMRRAAWVEAYYWMATARRRGMRNLSDVMRQIRMNWAQDGFPDEETNVSKIFPETAGSLGRALLHVDSGHDAASARDFLQTHYPDFF